MAEVLVVDDDPDIRMLVAFALEDSGYTVRQASDGEAALGALEAKAPDAMVLDVMMPGTDGFGVLRGMRAKRIAPETRVILLTCKTEERDHLRGWELGADEYLTKPFDPEELVARVRWLLQSSGDALAERRESELQKAELLDRLEAAFNKSRAAGGPAAGLLSH
ncbi:MAG TPA: response regulator transcription factor [Acidimicrobiales bacterium]|nr:response regulator transcription factor [Acidimicrobiales bacterium]